MSTPPPGWLPDPTGRHELRYWDGQGWTEHVSDRGHTSTDPLAPQPRPETQPQPPPWASGPPGGQPAPGYPQQPWAPGPPGPLGAPGPPGGMPPAGYGYGYGGPPPRGGSRTPLFVVLGIVVVAAVAAGAIYLTSSDDEDDSRRREYVDALASAMADSEDGIVHLGETENECLADAEVDIIGLDTLAEHVTPEQIRDDPDASLVDFGIQPTHDQGLEMVDALDRCVEDIGAALAAAIDANDLRVEDADAVGACLAEDFGSDEVRDLLAASFTTDDDADMTEDQATAAVDWLGGCVDFRALVMDAVDADTGAMTADCVDGRLRDDWVRDSLVAEFTGDDDAAGDLDAELEDVIDECRANG